MARELGCTQIARSVPFFNFKYPEGADMEFLRANANLGTVFVDVGANVGILSALMADKFDKIVMFEPSDESFRSIESMVHLNGGKATFELHKVAVADRSGSFFLDEGSMSATSRIVNKPSALEPNVTTIKSDTLDNVLGFRFDRIVMKIDIEGGEESAFLGASCLFHEKRIRLVMFERLGRTNLDSIKDFMTKHDYQIFTVLTD